MLQDTTTDTHNQTLQPQINIPELEAIPSPNYFELSENGDSLTVHVDELGDFNFYLHPREIDYLKDFDPEETPMDVLEALTYTIACIEVDYDVKVLESLGLKREYLTQGPPPRATFKGGPEYTERYIQIYYEDLLEDPMKQDLADRYATYLRHDPLNRTQEIALLRIVHFASGEEDDRLIEYAKERLVASVFRSVWKIARKYSSNSLRQTPFDLLDLCQAGITGLVRLNENSNFQGVLGAMRKYSIIGERGTWVTYATASAKRAMERFIKNYARGIRIPGYGANNSPDFTYHKEIATVQEGILSLDKPLDDDTDLTLLETIATPEVPAQEESALTKAFDELPAEMRELLIQRGVLEMTSQELADIDGKVTRQAVDQRYEKALDILKSLVIIHSSKESYIVGNYSTRQFLRLLGEKQLSKSKRLLFKHFYRSIFIDSKGILETFREYHRNNYRPRMQEFANLLTQLPLELPSE